MVKKCKTINYDNTCLITQKPMTDSKGAVLYFIKIKGEFSVYNGGFLYIKAMSKDVMHTIDLRNSSLGLNGMYFSEGINVKSVHKPVAWTARGNILWNGRPLTTAKDNMAVKQED